MKKVTVLMVLLCVGLLINCGGSKPAQEELIDLEPPVPIDTLKPEPVIDLEPEPEPKPEPILEPAIIKGYRVQLYAFKDSELAEIAKKNAQNKIAMPLYVDFIDGLYKVRAGNFKTRIEAEAYRQQIANEGFYDAFIVESDIIE